MNFRKKWLVLGYRLALKDIRYFTERFSTIAHEEYVAGLYAFAPKQGKTQDYLKGQADAYDDIMQYTVSRDAGRETFAWYDGIVDRAKNGEADE